MHPDASIAARPLIRRIRRALDLTQCEMATVVKVSYASIRLYEQGRCTPRPVLVKLADICQRAGLSDLHAEARELAKRSKLTPWESRQIRAEISALTESNDDPAAIQALRRFLYLRRPALLPKGAKA